MRRCCGCFFGLFLLAGLVGAAEPQGKIVHETWDAAYLNGAKAGFVHTTVREFEQDDQKVLRSTLEFDLTLKRFTETVRVRMETGTDETPEGKVTGVSMRQFLGKEQVLVMTGVVEGDELHVKVNGPHRIDKKIPWDDKVVGMYAQERMFRERKVKPDDTFTYLSYEPQIMAVVTTQVTIKDYEDVQVPGTKARQRLLRVQAVGDKIDGFQPPPLISWLDKDLNPVVSQTEMQMLGKVMLYRTTRAVALGAGSDVARIPDIGKLIPVNRRLASPYDTDRAVYRITISGDDNPGTTFATDNRQQVKNVKGNTFELHVRGIHAPQAIDDPAPVKEEYLKSSYFINNDDAKVKEHARRAVGNEKDAWKQARLIERWVYRNMENKNFTEAFATADHVARTLEGDCTEHAVLAAAMCKAVGIPAKAAVGLIYADSPQGPGMAFHMWTEVWIQGQWIPIDATLGRGYVDATHLKISDHSWYDTQSLKPLLPLLRVLGKVKIEIVSASVGDR